MSKEYNPQKIEKKWQKKWAQTRIGETPDSARGENFYCLDMFPYPSGEGMHVGHMRGYTFSDAIARQKRMQGYNVLHPMGFDSFGLPAENYAIKSGVYPSIIVKKAMKRYREQMRSAGFLYDWSREVITSNPDYYRWTQWLFLKLFEKGLAYRKKGAVNWCPRCKTVLANEQVINGLCERCDNEVGREYLTQWYFKITDYADRLIDDLDDLDWPEKIKTMQKNWIGQSEGATIKFQIENSTEAIEVFTTRPDTLFGATYLVLAPEHPLIDKLAVGRNKKEIIDYQEKCKKISEIIRSSAGREKTGVFTGSYAVNPANNQLIPIWIADYVVMEYGTGAIMAVPAHDQRDFEFAAKYNLRLITVIKSLEEEEPPNAAYEGEGRLVNSQVFDGVDSEEAKWKIADHLAKKGLAKKIVQYKLRDWLISRQRYWGAPIPIIYCSKCGEVAVPEKNLPVLLSKSLKDFKPIGNGSSPLAKDEKFVNAKCPKCNGKARRETDTMDTFVCSSWYFLRFVDSKNRKAPFDKKKIAKWLPIDIYIGGAEHAVMHLLYARFFTKFMFDNGLLKFKEPFTRLFNQGTVFRLGAKMSKSRGNVVAPDDFFKKFGADTMRLYEMFMGPADQAIEWNDESVMGVYRFLNRAWKLVFDKKFSKQNHKNEVLRHSTIKKITDGLADFKFNTAISFLMEYTSALSHSSASKEDIKALVLLLSPMAPHICEQMWQMLGGKKSVLENPWPKYDARKVVKDKMVVVVQVDGKTRGKLDLPSGSSQQAVEKAVGQNADLNKWLNGQKPAKVVYIRDRLINFVLK